jgi:hypothetical protein
MEWIAGENRFDSEHAGAGAFSFPRCFGLDGSTISAMGTDRLQATDVPAGMGEKGYGLTRGKAIGPTSSRRRRAASSRVRLNQ